MFMTKGKLLVVPPYRRGRRSGEDRGAIDRAEVSGHDVALKNEA